MSEDNGTNGKRKARITENTPLTPLELRFIEEYLIDLNGLQAYKRAGYKPKNDESAKSCASEVLTKPNVAKFLLQRRDELFERIGESQKRVLLENQRLAYFDPRKLFNADGTPKKISELDDDTAACLGGVEVIELKRLGDDDKGVVAQVKKYKIIDKNPALDRFFRYHALYKDLGSKDNPLNLNVKTFIVPAFDGSVPSPVNGNGTH